MMMSSEEGALEVLGGGEAEALRPLIELKRSRDKND
jgi:hypothetical protein